MIIKYLKLKMKKLSMNHKIKYRNSQIGALDFFSIKRWEVL